MTAGQALAGEVLTAATVRGAGGLLAMKKSPQGGTLNSTTLANDNDLVLAIPASTNWDFEALLVYTGDVVGTGGLKFGWTVPSGATLTWCATYWPSSALLSAGTPSMQVFTATTATRTAVTNGTTALHAQISGSIINGSTAGNLQVQWCQSGTGASTVTTMQTGSKLGAWQVP